MHALIVTLGTRGDIEIFLALARELRRRGHAVTLGTSPFYAATVAAAGIGYAALGNGACDELRLVLRSLSTVADLQQRTRLFFARWLRPQLAAARRQIEALAANAECFVSNLKLAIRRDGRTMPGAFVTYDPPASVADLRAYGSADHAGRIIELVALSRPLIDPQGQWPKDFHFTGFWTADDAAAPPQPELERFIAGGPPPVAVTLGSMISFDAATLLRHLSEALAAVGRRAVIIGGWSGIGSADSVSGLTFCTPEAPYGWLFARCACVLHHGGCGTTAAVLRAGVPSIVMPQILCQQELAAALTREGLAAATLDSRCINAADLAAAIAAAATDAELLATAQRWRDIIHQEPGVAAAADLIEAHWMRCVNDS